MTKDNLLIYLKNKPLNVGLEAIRLNEYNHRIVKFNNMPYPIIDDFRTNRINLELQNGVIINAEIY